MKSSVQLCLQGLMVFFCTLERYGLTSENFIQRKNNLFMYQSNFIENLYQTGSIETSQGSFSRETIENLQADFPIEIFESPLYARPEILREAQDEADDQIQTMIQSGISLSEDERNTIFQTRFEELAKKLANSRDPQVIEGVALALAPSNTDRLMSIFLALDQFKTYAPDVFLESIHLTKAHLRPRRIFKLSNHEYQFSKINIHRVIFTHTLRYEITSEQRPFKVKIDHGQGPVIEEQLLDCPTVAWEIAPEFHDDLEFGQNGVLMNNGMFQVEPYVNADGIADLNRSLILYHIYIKIAPLNCVMETLKDMFKNSEARNVLYSLAHAMRREAGKK